MAGTATRFDSTKIRAGSIGQLWAGLAVPAASGRLSLWTDGTPDATANPSAKHLGHTAAGTTLTLGFTVTDHFVDETPFPIKTSSDTTSMSMSGSLVQVFDEEMLKIITANIGTYSTAAGYKQFTIGAFSSLSYTSAALIFPTEADPTKFAVFHIYNGMNTNGLTFAVDRKGRSETPFTITGYALTARAQADQVGNYWWQTA
jgi:hypothetical protein